MVSIECSCCWEFNQDLLVCNEGHFSCRECINRAVNVAIGYNKTLCCFKENCKANYPDYAIKLAVNNIKVIDLYFEIVLLNSLKDLNIHSCPFCPNRIEINNEQNVFFCIGGCKKYSCIKCQKDSHEGGCELTEKQKSDELKTKNHVIQCCGNVFIRGDACNKVYCPTCDVAFCWLCKKKNIDYEHFNNTFCMLYGEDKRIAIPQVIPQVIPNSTSNSKFHK
jgi:hypothetical protein